MPTFILKEVTFWVTDYLITQVMAQVVIHGKTDVTQKQKDTALEREVGSWEGGACIWNGSIPLGNKNNNGGGQLIG